MFLFYIRSCNDNLEYFISDKRYSSHSNLFCSSKTGINDSPAKYIDEILDSWKGIHKNMQHDLGLSWYLQPVFSSCCSYLHFWTLLMHVKLYITHLYQNYLFSFFLKIFGKLGDGKRNKNDRAWFYRNILFFL